MKKRITFFSVLSFFAVFLFILSFSISLPIFIRQFYYAHIDAYDLPASSGFTKNEIKIAYDEILDYLTFPGTTTFSAGVMKFSDDGVAHFLDCKKLFTLNSVVLLISFITLVFVLFLLKRNKITLKYTFGHSPIFWSGLVSVFLPLLCGIGVSIDPNRAFIIFHKIFFPGKTNWIFNPHTDEIISVLPQQFFINCAIFIGAGIIFLSVICIIFDIIIKRRDKQ